MTHKMTVTWFTIDNESGNEVENTFEFPARWEVCPECEGSGYTLSGGMRGACYTMEEFEEAFSPEDQSEYFRRGGIYDTTCDVCNGRHVIEVIAEQYCTTETQKKALAEYRDQENDRLDYERECRREREMGC